LLFEMQGLSFAFWIFLAFVAGLVANWLIRSGSAEKIRSRLDRGDKAFFRGVQHILSNEPDRAIEQFTKSVQINSETIETYVALANLYSSTGDIERAIRIRQGIILRPNLDSAIRLRAIFDLGSDYKRGGFLDRALSAFQKVVESEPNNLEAHEQIERIYEDLHDWDRAFKTRQTISKLVKGDHRHILAHHKTELAKFREKDGDEVGAEKAYKEAISIFDGCVDAYLHLGDLYLSQQRHKAALAKWKKVADVAPEFTFLAYQRLERAYAKMDNPGLVGDFLKEVARQNSDVSSQLALARYLYNEGEVDAAVDQVKQAIKLAPSFLDARKFMGEVLLKEGRNEEALVAYKELLLSMDFPFLQFRCNNCGYRPEKLAWRCPQCLKWDSIGIIEPPPLGLPNGHSPS
jgi:lipopolysaccharide biosynthesis regulator YciM